MTVQRSPTGPALVGALFICLSFLGQGTPLTSGTAGALHPSHSPVGQLELPDGTVYFLWSSISPATAPTRESVLLDGSSPKVNLSALLAANSKRQRDIFYSGTQGGEANVMDVRVAGSPGDYSDRFEDLVDSSILRSTTSGVSGNLLSVEVSGITVSALNTVEGGSAVAVSNIIIEPVQIIVLDREVEEKLG